MHSNCKINISGSTYKLVKDNTPCSHIGKIETKNKGEVNINFVEDKKGIFPTFGITEMIVIRNMKQNEILPCLQNNRIIMIKKMKRNEILRFAQNDRSLPPPTQ